MAGPKVKDAMAKMEDFEREFHDSEHELDDVTGVEAAPEPEPEPAPESKEPAPEPDIEAAPGGAEVEPTAGGKEPEAGTPEPKTYPIPNDPEVWGELAGKKVTEEEFLKSGLVNKLLTREHQELHHMKKYQDEVPALRAEVDALKKAQQAVAKPPAPKKEPITQERVEAFGQQLEKTFLPSIEKFAKMGGIEEHLVTDAPRFLSTLEFRFQSGQKLLDVLTKGFGALAADWVERHKAEESSSARSILESTMLQVASNDGFNDLRDAERREEFGHWLAGQKAFANLDVNELGTDDMEIAYMKYMRSKSKGAPSPTAKPAPKRKTAAMLATGGGAGSRGSASSSTKGAIEGFLAEYNESMRNRE